MKNLIVILLLFITSNGFAIDQYLIDGAKKYDKAVIRVKTIEKIKSDDFDRYFKNYNPNRYESEYQEKLVLIKKLDPVKKEYIKQKEKERRRQNIKDTIIGFIQIMGLPIAFFILWIFWVRFIIRRNKRLIKEGKLTKEGYRKMMAEGKSSMFDDNGINASTGLPLTGIGISDAGGNIRGSSSDRYHR